MVGHGSEIENPNHAAAAGHRRLRAAQHREVQGNMSFRVRSSSPRRRVAQNDGTREIPSPARASVAPRRRVVVAGLFVSLLAVILALAGCGGEEPAPGPVTLDAAEQEAWEIALVEMRIEKNERFMDPEQSPLPASLREGFEGLNYYYPAPDLHYRVPFVAASAPDTVTLAKHKGREVPYVKRGTVTFRHDDANHTLAVFGPASAGADDYLWLPFYDATNADETYPGGRYLDLELAEDGTVDLDFNYAYNPLCDYNPEHFDCTLPPQENTLPFRVEAGEQRFGAETTAH
jgi:uncharacterized protein (DUF1684 family)